MDILFKVPTFDVFAIKRIPLKRGVHHYKRFYTSLFDNFNRNIFSKDKTCQLLEANFSATATKNSNFKYIAKSDIKINEKDSIEPG